MIAQIYLIRFNVTGIAAQISLQANARDLPLCKLDHAVVAVTGSVFLVGDLMYIGGCGG